MWEVTIGVVTLILIVLASILAGAIGMLILLIVLVSLAFKG